MPALAWLGEGTNDADAVTDCLEVSKRWFPELGADVPDGGFANSAAFTDEKIAERLWDGYERMLDVVCFPSVERSTLDEVRARARSLAGRI